MLFHYLLLHALTATYVFEFSLPWSCVPVSFLHSCAVFLCFRCRVPWLLWPCFYSLNGRSPLASPPIPPAKCTHSAVARNLRQHRMHIAPGCHLDLRPVMSNLSGLKKCAKFLQNPECNESGGMTRGGLLNDEFRQGDKRKSRKFHKSSSGIDRRILWQCSVSGE